MQLRLPCLQRLKELQARAIGLMEQNSITILKQDGTTTERPMNFNPFDLEAAHIFKIWGSKIHEIEAMGFSLPLYSKNGWNPFIK